MNTKPTAFRLFWINSKDTDSETLTTGTDVLQDLRELREWKRQMLIVDSEWDKVRKYIQETATSRIGESYSVLALERIKERDSLMATRKDFAAAKPTVDPEEGYRLLVDGETIADGDEYLSHGGGWTHVLYPAGATYSPREFQPHRRQIFDWSALWAQLPPWVGFVAMDEDKRWYSSQGRPKLCAYFWDAGGADLIPAGYAPPTEPDWTKSLKERPTP